MHRLKPLLIALAALLAALGPGPAMAKKLALVIGNDAYDNLTDLRRAREDAGGYRDFLAARGFEVTHATDLEYFETADVLAAFYDRIAPGDEVVFVYSGHGWSDGSVNYLIPTDAPASGSEAQIRTRSIPLKNGVTGVLDQIDQRGAALTVVIFDACRDNPFTSNDPTRTLGLDRGLVRVTPPQGAFVTYSAGEGQTALDRLSDDDPAPYSVFTRFFLAELGRGKDLLTAVKDTQAAVDAAARRIGHAQQPAFYDRVIGRVCLGESCEVASAAPARPTQPSDTSRADWLLVKDSRSIAVLKAFIAKHPGTLYAGLAEERIEVLQKPEAPVESEPLERDEPVTTEMIRATQEVLNRLGYSVGTPDGIVGPRTRRELRKFQRQAGIENTGEVDWPTMAALSEEYQAQLKRLADQEADPADDPDLSAFRDCSECPEMVVIPTGDFLMGSPPGEEGRYDNEGPQRRVTVETFALARTEVTVGQYRAFLRETGYAPGKGCYVLTGSEWEEEDGRNWASPGFSQTDDHPVTCVSWEDAQRYIAWLNTKVSGSPYRLPSEAEWEYAARANSTTRFSWGDGEAGICGRANLADASTDFDWAVSCIDGFARTAPVGRFPANTWGLSDMIGNVWEWVEDCWHGSYRNAPVTAVPWLQANGGDCSRRMVRGGSWFNAPRDLRSAVRSRSFPEFRLSDMGFRPARTLVTP